MKEAYTFRLVNILKKILLVFLTALFLFIPTSAFAADCEPGTSQTHKADGTCVTPAAGGTTSNSEGFSFNIKQPLNSGVDASGDIGTTIGTVFQNIITIIFVIATLIFLFMIIIGALQWIMSGGNKESLAAAKSRITHALIGLVILALSFLLVTVFGTIVGINIVNNDFTIPTLNSGVGTTTGTAGGGAAGGSSGGSGGGTAPTSGAGAGVGDVASGGICETDDDCEGSFDCESSGPGRGTLICQ